MSLASHRARNPRRPSPSPPMRVLSFIQAAPGATVKPLPDSLRQSTSSYHSIQSVHSVQQRPEIPIQHHEIPKPSAPHAMPLSVVQEDILHWMESYDVSPASYVSTEDSRRPSHLSLTDVAKAFKDGILLCRLVSRLEGREVSGVDSSPRSTAAELVNINRALAVLRQRRNMNARWLWAADAIQHADPVALWGLLDDMRKEFSASGGHSHAGGGAALSRSSSPQRSVLQAHQSSQSLVAPPPAPTPVLTKPLTDTSDSKLSETESEVRRWLLNMGFALTDHGTAMPTLADPMRNGVLLCELVAFLEGTPISGYAQKPKSLDSARANFEAALTVLRRRPQIPPVYLWQTEELLKGTRDAVWGLLWHIKHAYPKAQPDERHRLLSTTSPYPDKDTQRLEVRCLCYCVPSLLTTELVGLSPSVALLDRRAIGCGGPTAT